MIRLTFVVSALSFAAKTALRQNALDNLETLPQAVQAALKYIYVDNGLMVANSVPEAIHLRREMQKLFVLGGFKLRKWKSNKRDVLASIRADLKHQKIRQ